MASATAEQKQEHFGETARKDNWLTGPLAVIIGLGIFIAYSTWAGLDGRYPQAALVQGSDGSFYGTTDFGGTNGDHGTIFKMTAKGIFTSLLSFSGTNENALSAQIFSTTPSFSSRNSVQVA